MHVLKTVLLTAGLLFIPLSAFADDLEQLPESQAPADQVQKCITCDEQGRVRFVKGTDGEFSEFFYYPDSNRIRVVVSDKKSTAFRYDKHGNLIRAFTTLNQLILLRYDKYQRISRMIETNLGTGKQRDLAFEYNGPGKPAVIVMRGKGKITVVYDQNGRILRVNSKQGVRMTLEVAAAFQSLLSVVKVADTSAESKTVSTREQCYESL